MAVRDLGTAAESQPHLKKIRPLFPTWPTVNCLPSLPVDAESIVALLPPPEFIRRWVSSTLLVRRNDGCLSCPLAPADAFLTLG